MKQVRYAVLTYVDSEGKHFIKLVDADEIFITIVDFRRTQRVKEGTIEKID